jgi:hypothetical protein
MKAVICTKYGPPEAYRTLASEFPIRCLLRKNFILTRRASCQNKSAGQGAYIMTIVRSISPEAKAIYKIRRENL